MTAKCSNKAKKRFPSIIGNSCLPVNAERILKL